MKTKTKQILSALLALLMLFGALPATVFAAGQTNPLDYLTYEIADGEVTITDCDTSISGELTIPETIEGYPVTGIGEWAFENCTDLTNVKIPDSVISIGYEAFKDCTGLTNITIGKGVTSIGGCAFLNTAYYNNDLNWENDILYIGKYLIVTKEDIAGSRTVKNGTKLIADHAFSLSEGLTGITIPNSVTSIGYEAFYGCTGLTSIIIPNSVTYIGWNAFEGCTGLTSITIPNSVTSIGEYVFNDCTGLTSITIPNSITSIGYRAFGGCTRLTSITIPNSVTSIGNFAFYGCTGLTSITIPNSVTNIGAYVFNGCSSLTSITIPNSVTYIGLNAFEGCTGLTSVTIPNSVTSIGSEAFYGCTGLTSVTIPNSVTYIDWNAFGYYKDGKIPNFKIYCYSGTAGEQYAKDNGFEYEILKEECAHKLKHITVPASCTVNGMEYDLCTECGDTFNSKVIAALGHSWGNWYVSKQPTESADGEETRKCTKCSEIETRKIEKLKTVKDEKTGVEIIYKDEFEKFHRSLTANRSSS